MHTLQPRRRWLPLSVVAAMTAVIGIGGAVPAGATAGSDRDGRPLQAPRELSPEQWEMVKEYGQRWPLDERGATIPAAPHHLEVVPPERTAGGPGTDPGDKFEDPSTREVFDIDRFERNLRAALDGKAVGYAYSIGKAGQLYSQDGVGQARATGDSPVTAQSPTKPMTVASISKPVTAMLVLRLFEQEGISVDDEIGPWLPEAWDPGVGVDQITFRELMTHTSGLQQNFQQATGVAGKSTGSWPNIRIAVEGDVTDKSYSYANMNFSIFRLIVPKVLGYDYSTLYDDLSPWIPPEIWDQLTGQLFESYLVQTLDSIGVTATCTPTDPNPTILYGFPHDGQPGWETPSYVLGCGGYGFYLSANGLTGFLSYLRYTDELVSPGSRQLMNDGLLGWKSYPGAHGDYLGHGGDWGSGGKEMHGCAMSFHIHVDVSLLVNSSGGYGSPCSVLRTAFDAAWVSP